MAQFSKIAILAFAFATIPLLVLANHVSAKNDGAVKDSTAAPKESAAAAKETAGSSKSVKAVRLFMNSQFYGDVNVLVSDLGARFSSSRAGMQLIALPPDGRMFAFNDEAKKICKVDVNRFSAPGLYRSRYESNKSKALFFPTGNTAKIGGLNAIEFANYRKKDLLSLRELRVKMLRSGHPEEVVIPAEIWATTDFTIPKCFIFLVSKISQIREKELFQLLGPSKSKLQRAPLPLRILQITDDGRKILAIDTVKAKQTTATARDFVLPAGFTQVSNELQLFGDDSFDLGGQDSVAPAKGNLPSWSKERK